MKLTRVLHLLPLIALAACTQFPELEGTVAPELEKAAYPDLLPLEPILAQAVKSGVDPVQAEAGLEGRLAGLRARADRLRGSVLSGPEKQRLERGL